MFDFFKRGIRTKAALEIIWPLLSLYCIDEKGKIDEKLESDGYALAYIYGALAFTISKMNIKSEQEAGIILLKAFEHIFPNRGRIILGTCVVRLESEGDSKFRKDMMEAVTELEPFFHACTQGEVAAKQALSNAGPSSLQKYLKKRYQ
jgi:hypothetical protein